MTDWSNCLRFELEIDAVQVERLETCIEALGVERWTVVSAHSGRTGEGRWSRAGQITASGRRMLVLFSVPHEQADRVRTRLGEELERLNGDAVSYSVTVCRH